MMPCALCPQVLRPFAEVQKFLEGDKYITLSMVPLFVHGIKKHLSAALEDPAMASIRPLIATLLDDMQRRWEDIPLLALVACAFDPRVKGLHWLTDEPLEQDKVWDVVKRL